MTDRTQQGTVRLTVAQAVVTYLSRQYSVADGERRRLVPAALGIFGHGNVAGLGQALDQLSDQLPFVQGRNEQALVHIATAYAKATKRHSILAVTASIGPGALNMVTGAGLATVNRLPVLLLPGDTYATRHQGPVLQQLQHPIEADASVNDAFRPVSRFFDRITRPEQLLTALPAAMRALTDVDTGAVVVSLPQDIQSHAYDYPVAFFAEHDWPIRRPAPDADEVAVVARLLAEAEKPLIIAGGGVVYSGATEELEALADAAGVPVVETFAGKGAVQRRAWWQLGGIGLEGTPAVNTLAREADFVLTVGSRLTDFATASHSLFENPDVRFASINVNVHDAGRLGATGIVADAKRALVALTEVVRANGTTTSESWQDKVRTLDERWQAERTAALDPDTAFDFSALADDSDVVRDTEAALTQGQLIGLLQEHAQAGDTIIAAAGGPPGDLQKVWDATEGRFAHLEFGFSCMGYELPAAIGVRFAQPDASKRVLSLLGDGTFLMAPTELVTAAQERLPITIVIPENHGYQVIHRLQMGRNGREFGNEFRYRDGSLEIGSTKPARLEGGYLQVDLVKTAEGLGARALRATTAGEVRAALADTRDHDGPVVLVVPVIPHADLPGAGVWWDVAPAEVSEQEAVAQLRDEYEEGLASQRWYG
jgi:3D-(3,5/4)-trihydroxycyclohexane-1,2-dione acylhydrolase (decyclizing)